MDLETTLSPFVFKILMKTSDWPSLCQVCALLPTVAGEVGISQGMAAHSKKLS